MNSKVKNPVLVLILSLVTCGIYPMIFVYQTSEELKKLTGDQNINPVLELILSLVTCGIYFIYWCYKYSKMIFDVQHKNNVSAPNDVSLIAIILTVLGLSCVSLMLMQTELNKVWENTPSL